MTVAALNTKLYTVVSLVTVAALNTELYTVVSLVTVVALNTELYTVVSFTNFRTFYIKFRSKIGFTPIFYKQYLNLYFWHVKCELKLVSTNSTWNKSNPYTC